MRLGIARRDSLALAAIGLGWLALWFSGRPLPHVDDLFCVGAAVNLAAHHGLENPWARYWMEPFGTLRYYIYPPFHSYLLAAWLRMTGVGTASILAFTDLAGFAACSGIYLLLRRAAADRWAALFAAAISAQFILVHGLRDDADGIALLAFAILCWLRAGHGWWFAGCFLGAFAPATAPFLSAVIVPIGLWRLFKRKGEERTGPKVALALAASGLIFALLALAVHGEIGLFWSVLQKHAAFRTSGAGRHFRDFFDQLVIGREWLLHGPALLVLICAAWVSWRCGDRRQLIAMGALFVGFLALGIRLYAGYTAHYAYFLAFLVAAALLAKCDRESWRRPLLFAAWVAVGLVGLFPDVISICLQRTGDGAELARLRSEVRTIARSRLLVDEFAARYVYGYRLPPDAVDWMNSRGVVTMECSLRDKPPGDVWLVNALKLDLYVPDSGVRADRVRFLGHVFSTHVARLDDIRLVR